MTHLAVSIFVNEIEQARRDIARSAEAGASLVELRIDQLDDLEGLKRLLKEAIVPCIVTCRPVWEGGQYAADEPTRQQTLLSASQSGAAYLDIELKATLEPPLQSLLADVPRDQRPGVIRSFHDFQTRPDKLYGILANLDSSPGEIAKIVWMARSIRDNLEAFEILQSRRRPTIALCMGEAGLISRVLAKKFGAFLTFASLTKETGTASGQVPITDLKRLYRWDALHAGTKVYGVVAKPVMHSMSPAIHNAAFDKTGHDGVYLPLLVDESYEAFKAFMESFLAFPGMNLRGLSITIPHKENALRYLRDKNADIEELAARIGAVNTIVIGEDGALRGMNTDYAAILDSITSRMGITREQLSGIRVAVLGAGGTGRTAVAALAHYGATVVVYNRTMERAQALADEFNGRSGKVVAARMDKLCDSCCQIYINTTSVGMHPHVDASPMAESAPKLSADTLVFDTIYNPMKTRLLREAESHGAKTIGGVEMFVRQAAAQFEAWTGLPAPVDLMRQTIESRLQGV